MTDVLIIAAYASLSTALGWNLHRFAGLDIVSAVLSGAVAFLLLLQFKAMIARVRESNDIVEELDDLRAANSAIETALNEAKKRTAEVTTALAKRSEFREKKMIGELQIIEGLIRDFSASMAAKAKPGVAAVNESPVDAPQPRASGDSHALELIRRSLEDNRVDLYLQPVVSLPQRKVKFYEALSRLRSHDGTVIMPAQYITVAAPAGLMSVVDNLLLFRCVQVVRRMAQKQRELGVFCNISGHTLTDREFFPQFLDFMHRSKDLSSQIIFEFSQEAVLAAGPAEEANLKYLSGLGFKLSMDQVSKLDLDFARLQRLGFSFAKVRAEMLISGMHSAQAQVAAEDFKDLLARNGIALIAERVEDERAVVQLLEYNVDFGQGYLFGEPRPIREVGEIHDPRVQEQTAVGTTRLATGLAKRLAG